MSAERYGNEGIAVFATLRMIGVMETAAVLAIAHALQPGEATVGTHVNVRHEAATPVGMTVRATARLAEIDGRRLVFEVEAWDDEERIGSGTHERVVVDRERFLHRVKRKAPGP
jgi:predicted thioesterase